MNKRTIITALLAILTMVVSAQAVDSTSVKPEFPGGEKGLSKYLKKNVKYPELAEEYHIEGKVIMHFIVDTDGSVKDITASDCTIDRFKTTRFSQETEARQTQLKEQFALLFAKEGARVIKKMPKWKPAMLNGEKVKARYNLTIRFLDPNN